MHFLSKWDTEIRPAHIIGITNLLNVVLKKEFELF